MLSFLKKLGGSSSNGLVCVSDEKCSCSTSCKVINGKEVCGCVCVCV